MSRARKLVVLWISVAICRRAVSMAEPVREPTKETTVEQPMVTGRCMEDWPPAGPGTEGKVKGES